MSPEEIGKEGMLLQPSGALSEERQEASSGHMWGREKRCPERGTVFLSRAGVALGVRWGCVWSQAREPKTRQKNLDLIRLK